MAITKIDDIYLYTDLSWDPTEVSESVDAKAFLDACGLTYIHLNYADSEQHPFVFAPLSSWSFSDGTHTIESFPFVVYTEIHDDLSPANYPKVLLYGLDEIENYNLPELYQLGR